MGTFYKLSRFKNNILVKDNKPEGGKWSYDEENRKKIPKGLNIPKIIKPLKSNHTINLIPHIEKEFFSNVGNLNNFWLPTTRKDSLNFLNDFINNKFNLFGDYEDAISAEDDFLFHSALSPILNLGLLTPDEIFK